MKAMIVDIQNGYAAALNEEGVIEQIPDINYTLGQTVELYKFDHTPAAGKQKKRHRLSAMMKKISVAASSAIVLSGLCGAVAYALPAGTVTVDAEPSIEYTVNCFDYVLDVKAANDDGDQLLSEMDLWQIKHHKVETALSLTMEQLEKDGYLDTANAKIQIEAEMNNQTHAEELQKKLETMLPEENQSIPVQSGQNTEGNSFENTEGRREEVPQTGNTPEIQDSGASSNMIPYSVPPNTADPMQDMDAMQQEGPTSGSLR